MPRQLKNFSRVFGDTSNVKSIMRESHNINNAVVARNMNNKKFKRGQRSDKTDLIRKRTIPTSQEIKYKDIRDKGKIFRDPEALKLQKANEALLKQQLEGQSKMLEYTKDMNDEQKAQFEKQIKKLKEIKNTQYMTGQVLYNALLKQFPNQNLDRNFFDTSLNDSFIVPEDRQMYDESKQNAEKTSIDNIVENAGNNASTLNDDYYTSYMEHVKKNKETDIPNIVENAGNNASTLNDSYFSQHVEDYEEGGAPNDELLPALITPQKPAEQVQKKPIDFGRKIGQVFGMIPYTPEQQAETEKSMSKVSASPFAEAMSLAEQELKQKKLEEKQTKEHKRNSYLTWLKDNMGTDNFSGPNIGKKHDETYNEIDSVNSYEGKSFTIKKSTFVQYIRDKKGIFIPQDNLYVPKTKIEKYKTEKNLTDAQLAQISTYKVPKTKQKQQ